MRGRLILPLSRSGVGFWNQAPDPAPLEFPYHPDDTDHRRHRWAR